MVHCDAAQAIGKVPADVNEWDIDLMSISAHKLYGPKGVGALYIKGGLYSMPLKPLVIGGGQERQLRAGTLNVPGIVGFGEACELCRRLMPDEAKDVLALRDHLESELLARIEGAWRNGAPDERLPGNSSLAFPGIDAEALIVNTPDLAISTGSACTSDAPEPSHVLLAIGRRKEADSTIRIGVGRFNNKEDREGDRRRTSSCGSSGGHSALLAIHGSHGKFRPVIEAPLPHPHPSFSISSACLLSSSSPFSHKSLRYSASSAVRPGLRDAPDSPRRSPLRTPHRRRGPRVR